MKQLRIWFMRSTRRQVPAPVAAVLLLLVAAAALAWVCIDSSTVGLPPPGAPGRFDTGTAKHYKQWRLSREAEKARFYKEHPEYVGIPEAELGRYMRNRETHR